MSKLGLGGLIIMPNGLSLIDLEAATKSIMVHWMMKACEDGKSNLHFLIHFKLQNACPNRKENNRILGSDGCF